LKKCTKCEQIKPTTQFGNKSWINSDGSKTTTKKSHCRSCVNEDNLNRYHNNPNTREAHKRASYKHRIKSYGLTPEDYEILWDRSQGKCEICGVTPIGLLFIDHNHSTGKVRGLLCSACNSALDMLKEDFTIIRQLEAYLRLHNESDCTGL
jgi:hypothetical protein